MLAISKDGMSSPADRHAADPHQIGRDDGWIDEDLALELLEGVETDPRFDDIPMPVLIVVDEAGEDGVTRLVRHDDLITLIEIAGVST